MKYLGIALLLLTMMSAPAAARLGEDESTAAHRYGDPVREEQVDNYDKKLFYQDSPYNLAITYLGGRAMIITYQLENKGEMSIWRISNILDDNAKKEGGWKSIWFFTDRSDAPGLIEFINEQQNAVAAYDLSDNSLTVRYKTD